MPKISFVCPSYNHEKFVAYAIESILNQSEQDFELIIVDDCSADKNVSEIKKFNDKRIKLIEHKYNQGIAASTVDGCLAASSDIISQISSDDLLVPDYVKKILDVFSGENYDAVYTAMRYIDENNNFEDCEAHPPISLTQEEIFARTFTNVNFIPFNGLAVRKSFLLSMLPKHFSMMHFIDVQMHLAIFFKGCVRLLDEPLVLYRVHPNNVSRGNRRDNGGEVFLRERIEMRELMNKAVELIGENTESFNRFFGSHPLIAALPDGCKIYPQTIKYWLARIALTSQVYEKQMWGLAAVYDFISSRENLEMLNKIYGFTFDDYMSFAALIKVPISEETKRLIKKVKKYKSISKILGAALLAIALIFILINLINHA